MALTLNKAYVGLRASISGDALVFLPQEGFCDGVILNTPYIGLRAAKDDGELVFLVGDQKVNGAGNLIIDKPYIGLLAGQDNGVPVYVIQGKDCTEGGPFTACTCEICCTLDATVQLPSIADPDVWSTGIDVTLNCGETFTTWAGYISCLNNEVEDDTYVICYGETTYESRTADVVNFMGTDYTISSEIWKSEEFIYNTLTYRLIMIAASYSYMSGETLVEGCELYVILQKKVDTTVCGYQWCNISVTRATGGGLGGSGLTFPDLMIVTDPSFTSCAAGYSENGSGNCGSAGTMQSVSLDSEPDGQVDCPIVIAIEHIEPISTKVAKILITDNCEA